MLSCPGFHFSFTKFIRNGNQAGETGNLSLGKQFSEPVIICKLVLFFLNTDDDWREFPSLRSLSWTVSFIPWRRMSSSSTMIWSSVTCNELDSPWEETCPGEEYSQGFTSDFFYFICNTLGTILLLFKRYNGWSLFIFFHNNHYISLK